MCLSSNIWAPCVLHTPSNDTISRLELRWQWAERDSNSSNNWQWFIGCIINRAYIEHGACILSQLHTDAKPIESFPLLRCSRTLSKYIQLYIHVVFGQQLTTNITRLTGLCDVFTRGCAWLSFRSIEGAVHSCNTGVMAWNERYKEDFSHKIIRIDSKV